LGGVNSKQNIGKPKKTQKRAWVTIKKVTTEKKGIKTYKRVQKAKNGLGLQALKTDNLRKTKK
jgi:hypothetical protein